MNPFSLPFFFLDKKNIIKGEGVSNRPNKQMNFILPNPVLHAGVWFL